MTKTVSAKSLFDLHMEKYRMWLEAEMPMRRARLAPGATPEEAAILDRLLIDINVREMAEKMSLELMGRALELLNKKKGDTGPRQAHQAKVIDLSGSAES
jgi:hypothetical protein